MRLSGKDLSHAASSIRKFRAKQQLRKAAGAIIAMQRMAGISWKTPSSDKSDRAADAHDIAAGGWGPGVSSRSGATGSSAGSAMSSVRSSMKGSSGDPSPGASPADSARSRSPTQALPSSSGGSSSSASQRSPTGTGEGVVGVGVRLKSQRAIRFDLSQIEKVGMDEELEEGTAPLF
jgi:hypothetical protein